MISIIVAISKNRVIGKDNKLLWHIPQDLARFKKLTNGHPVIMGRKTFESIGKVLPDRTNIIITSDRKYRAKSALITHSLAQALNCAKDKQGSEEIFIIGGASVYSQALLIADKLYITVVHTNIDGDAYFPDYSMFTKEIFRQDNESDGYKYTFLELEKE
jgi:dihydrofolate reductase